MPPRRCGAKPRRAWAIRASWAPTRRARPIRARAAGPTTIATSILRAPIQQHWERLLKIMGREDLIGDPRFDSPQERFKNRHVVDEMIAEWTDPSRQDGGHAAARRAGHPRRRDHGYDGVVERSGPQSPRNLRHRQASGARRLQDAGLAGQDERLESADHRRPRCSAPTPTRSTASSLASRRKSSPRCAKKRSSEANSPSPHAMRRRRASLDRDRVR